MIASLKSKIPREVKLCILSILNYGNGFYCNCCNNKIKKFRPGGKKIPLFDKIRVIGAGYHENDYCPVCKSSYRTRIVKLYLDYIGILGKNIRVLHIAPEAQLAFILSKMPNIEYIAGDAAPELYSYYIYSIRVDLTSLKFDNNLFDLVICNHVLEHIPDDRQAMKELYRVLKPGGLAILQVPISYSIDHTIEDHTITSEEERLKNFGQKDHVRIYGPDYFKRLENTGFKTEIFNPFTIKSFGDISKLALDPDERIFIAIK
jgi:SAM-dependent methyltransferase